jgi:isoquinoline 1-oxidoreductase beta subunit
MIVAAAARAWGVEPSTVSIKAGVVSSASGKSATFGELAEKAAAEPVPKDAPLKDAKDFVFIGKRFARVDSPAKVKGQAKYTIDHQFDGMLIATIARPPLFGAQLQSFDASETKKLSGVVDVLPIPQGVAVLATSTWAALKGQRAVKVTWDETAAEKRTSADIVAAYKAKLDQDGAVAKKVGNIEDGFKAAAKMLEVEFEFPYLAHAPMEPMDCVIRFDGSSAEIWTGSQLQTIDHTAACSVLGLKKEAVQLHTVWAGGSFGRRAIADSHYVREA